MSMEAFQRTFVAECRELLAEMETRLLSEDSPGDDPEALNAIFRCAHSIKGGAGAFGWRKVTELSHELEALLDLARDGRRPLERDAIDLLLLAADALGKLVEAAAQGEEAPAGCGEDVRRRLQALLHPESAPEEAAKAPDGPTPGTAKRVFHITFTPHRDVLYTGNEPLLLLRALKATGECRVTADVAALPSVAELQSSLCYLSWNVTLITDRGEQAVREVFEFVEDHCDLTVSCDETAAPTEEDARAAPASAAEPERVGAREAAPAPTRPHAPPSPSASEPGSAESAGPLAGEKGGKSAAPTTVRVDVDKVDRLVNMAGELVITEAMINALIRRLPQEAYPELTKGAAELSHHTRELQEAVMSIRMQPVKSAFARMPRIVRDLSARLGKDVRLELYGQDTEVDKTVIERLSDPLIHLIRNAVDHGVETPETRERAGKPRQGVIKLSAFQRGGRIVIEIADDGAGLNRDRILERAKSRGLIAPDATPSDEEIDHLIFLPGFSTAEHVSDVSGRGVGMDVVKRNIEELEGTVRISSRPGKGCMFTASLPLTLAVLEGMVVRCGPEQYVIPINSILETTRPRPHEVRRLGDHRETLCVRGEYVAILYLYKLLSVKDAQTDPSKALVVLAENGEEKVGIVVDELVCQQQVVIKSLPMSREAAAGFSGATILGDGKVALILDVHGLCRLNAKPPKHYAA